MLQTCLKIRDAIPLLPQHAFMVCIETTFLYLTRITETVGTVLKAHIKKLQALRVSGRSLETQMQFMAASISIMKQQFVITHRYRVLQETETTWQILNRQTFKHLLL